MISFLPSSLADMFRAPYDSPHETSPIPRMTQHHRYPINFPLHRFHHHLRSSSFIFPTTQSNAPFIANDSCDTLHLKAANHHHFIAHPSIPSEPQGPPSNPARSHSIIIPVRASESFRTSVIVFLWTTCVMTGCGYSGQAQMPRSLFFRLWVRRFCQYCKSASFCYHESDPMRPTESYDRTTRVSQNVSLPELGSNTLA